MQIYSRSGIALTAFFLVLGAPRVSAQIEPYTPPVAASEGGDWTERITEILPEGVETRSEVRARIIAYEPDPETYPVPRSSWNGKPDFSGVYWPSVNVVPPPVPLESLYRPDVLDYREDGGAAVGVVDWRGIDTPRFHCWPRSPAVGSASGTVQLVSAPGYLLMLTDGQGNFRVMPIADEIETEPVELHEPSYQGSSIAHWEGDTLVVEVTNFNGRPWLTNSLPPGQLPQTSSDALRVTERWTRPDAQIIEYRVVIEDPKMLTAPWTGPVIRKEVLSYDT
ncbi:MAG: hypothetical protein ACR2QQ_16060, partial [Gammaproteobacteria bacterium]